MTMNCKYCHEEFDNNGKLLNHYKSCPAKVDAKLLIEQPVETGLAYVLVKIEDYIPYEVAQAEADSYRLEIARLTHELAETQKVDAVANGELYWPMSLLPKELSLLADGQFVSLKATGRIRKGKVLVQDVKV